MMHKAANKIGVGLLFTVLVQMMFCVSGSAQISPIAPGFQAANNYIRASLSSSENSAELSASIYLLSPTQNKYFQTAFRYMGHSAERAYRDGIFAESNGIANDSQYWYFSTGDPDTASTYIFRVSYTWHLNTSFDYDRKTLRPNPKGEGVCGHIGDIDVFEYNGRSYIIAPYENCRSDNDRAYIAIFDAADLGISGDMNPIAYIDTNPNSEKKAQSVAVLEDRQDLAKSSIILANRGYPLHKYEVDWDRIADGTCSYNGGFACQISKTEEIWLLNEQGERLDSVEFNQCSTKQGCDFSSDGKIFYLLVGYWGSTDPGDRYDCAPEERTIQAFDVESGVSQWRRIRKSKPNEAPFRFKSEGHRQEPEGISYYDTNTIANYHAEMPRGTLHAMNAWIGGGTEELTVKHYTSIISISPGDLDFEFYDKWGTNEGAWSGSIYVLEGGVYHLDRPLSASAIRYPYADGKKITKIVPHSGNIPVIIRP